MFCTTIDDYICLKIADLKRLGYLSPGRVCTGPVVWKRNGSVVASIGIGVKTTGVPIVRFSYDYNGEHRQYDVALRWKRSNLNADSPNGYYYFVCPDTGALCRNLYLVNGRFVGRGAFKALYPAQVESHRQRESSRGWRLLFDACKLQESKHRKEKYRGRLTPYGRKLQKLTQAAGFTSRNNNRLTA